MKKHFLYLAMSSALLSACAIASAEDKPFYFEAGFTGLTYTEPGYSLNPSAVRAVIGTKIYENIALEAMGAIGVASGKIGVVSLDLNNGIGLFVKPYVRVNDLIELFGRAGYFRGEYTATAPGVSLKTSGSDLAYGVGASIKVVENISLTVDYMAYYDKSSITTNGWTLGAKFGF
ncbi:MAG: outer membrane beta-barrel protein [Burkholderiales bacterium]|nr:outer membrane beta-barrel protein [Burkholderiales bacterium]